MSAHRLLANENIPRRLVERLSRAGHDVVWLRMAAPGSTDDDVLRLAIVDSRLLLTFDRDFGELIYKRGRDASCGVILLRLPIGAPLAFDELITRVISERDSWHGHFSVIEPDRIRMVPLP